MWPWRDLNWRFDIKRRTLNRHAPKRLRDTPGILVDQEKGDDPRWQGCQHLFSVRAYCWWWSVPSPVRWTVKIWRLRSLLCRAWRRSRFCGVFWPTTRFRTAPSSPMITAPLTWVAGPTTRTGRQLGSRTEAWITCTRLSTCLSRSSNRNRLFPRVSVVEIHLISYLFFFIFFIFFFFLQFLLYF